MTKLQESELETANELRSWMAVRVRPNFEQAVLRALQGKGLDSFLPTYAQERHWSDRKKTLSVPLFPGYLFCRTNKLQRLPILTIPAVKEIIGFSGIPATIPEEEIEAVRRFVSSDLPIAPCAFLHAGQRVLLEHGPLAGVEGILSEFRGKHRVIVSVSLLQRSIAAEVNANWIRPVNSLSIRRPECTGTHI